MNKLALLILLSLSATVLNTYLREESRLFLQNYQTIYGTYNINEPVYILGPCNMGEGYMTEYRSAEGIENVKFSGYYDKVEHIGNEQYCRFTVTGIKSNSWVLLNFVKNMDGQFFIDMKARLSFK